MSGFSFSSDALKRIRTKRGVTMQQLADAIGTYRPVICNYEAGKRQPTFRAAAAMAYALDVPVDTFVKHEEVAA